MKPLQGRQTTGKTELTQSLVLKWQMTSCHFYYRELEVLESMTQRPCARGLVYGQCVMFSTSGRKYAVRDSPRLANVKMRWPHNSPPALASLKLRGTGTKWPTMADALQGYRKPDIETQCRSIWGWWVRVLFVLPSRAPHRNLCMRPRGLLCSKNKQWIIQKWWYFKIINIKVAFKNYFIDFIKSKTEEHHHKSPAGHGSVEVGKNVGVSRLNGLGGGRWPWRTARVWLQITS